MARGRQRELLGADLRRLETQLRRLLGSGGIETAEADRLRILDLACGECFEAKMLAKLLRELAGEPAGSLPAVDFVGTDIREREISRAAERLRARVSGEMDFRFLAKDGQKLARDGDFGDAFDVVFVRHQNYYLGGKDWHALFEQSLEKLAPQGKLVITSYFDHEHELAKEAIERVGGELVKDIAHREARALAVEGKRVDKRLAMFRRKH